MSGAKKIVVMPLNFFGSTSTIRRFGEHFRDAMVSTVWSFSCLLFFYSQCPSCPAICKSGGSPALCALLSLHHCM